MAIELRPLSLSEKLAAALAVYRRNLPTLIGIVALVVIPVQIISTLAAWLFVRDVPIDPETGFIDTAAFDSGLVLAFIAGTALLVLITAIGNLLATAGVIKAIADDYLGVPPNWRDSIRFAWSKLGQLLLGSIWFALGLIAAFLVGIVAAVALSAVLEGLGVVLGVVVLVVFVVVLWVSWSIWVPALLVESLTGWNALARSNDLVTGRRWPVFGYFLVVIVLVWVVSALAATALLLPFGDDPGSPANSIVGFALALLTTPFVAAATVVLYFDQRARYEPFDTDELSAQLGDDGPSSDYGAFGDLPPDEAQPDDG